MKAPITDFFETSRMMTIINGTATTPLMTALQNSAFIGWIGVYSSATPAIMATAMTP